MSTGALGLLASYTRIVPLGPVMAGGVSKNIRSGASVQTPVAPVAGNVEVTCSSGVPTTGTSVPEGASTDPSTSPPPPVRARVPPPAAPPLPAAPGPANLSRRHNRPPTTK